MVCHVCGKPAVAQCAECWKFYCNDHGDIICSACRTRREDKQREDARLWKILEEEGPEAFRAATGANLILGESQEPTREQIAESRKWLMEGNDLKRVIPIAQSIPWGEKTFTLIALEIYADGSRLTYMTSSQEEPYFPRSDDPGRMVAYFHSQHPALRGVDDLGNEYRVSQGGGGGGKVWHGDSTVMPVIPQGASILSIYARVPMKAGQDPNVPSEHRFDIAL